jgi:hypothetical protein
MIRAYEISDRPGETLELGFRSPEEDYPTVASVQRLPTGASIFTRIGYLRGQAEMDWLIGFLDAFGDQINKALTEVDIRRFSYADILTLERVADVFEVLLDRALKLEGLGNEPYLGVGVTGCRRDINALRRIARKMRERKVASAK